MKHGKFFKKLVPASLGRARKIHLSEKALGRVPSIPCDVRVLRPMSAINLAEIFRSLQHDGGSDEVHERIKVFEIPDMTGGVNPGDRRALHQLVRYLKPKAVLEIGTHIGASTVHISSALLLNKRDGGKMGHLVTVDLANVNDNSLKPWLKFNSAHSPLEMIEAMGMRSMVDFVQDSSVHYLEHCDQRFDLIFLDGDHSSTSVYQEITLALKVIRLNGVIVLHDYFPELLPLWADGSVIPGPYLAVERLRSEGAAMTVIPLGELPWPTKMNSRVSSLALLLRE